MPRLVFLILFLIGISFHSQALLEGAVFPSAEPISEHKPCVDCFNTARNGYLRCVEFGQSESVCADHYQIAVDHCKKADICKIEDLKWSENRDLPLDANGIFGIEGQGNLFKDVPETAKAEMFQKGMIGAPLSESDASGIKSLDRPYDDRSKKDSAECIGIACA